MSTNTLRKVCLYLELQHLDGSVFIFMLIRAIPEGDINQSHDFLMVVDVSCRYELVNVSLNVMVSPSSDVLDKYERVLHQRVGVRRRGCGNVQHPLTAVCNILGRHNCITSLQRTLLTEL